jgi:hypothetical protein
LRSTCTLILRHKPCYCCTRMIAELFPQFYDIQGRKVLRPGLSQRRKGFRPTYPMGRNLTQPLKHPCKDFVEMRNFLRTCRAVDASQIEKRDYWQPPEEFEVNRKGDCVDFALWAWRQVLVMGYPARFAGGSAGKFGSGHAWVTFEKDGKIFLLEPQRWYLGLKTPRLSTLRYHPTTSVAWDGKKISYFVHEERNTDPPIRMLPSLIWEWIRIRGRFWAWVLPRLPLAIARKIFGQNRTQ